MTMEELNKIIKDFKEKTGDSPTHILVHPKSWPQGPATYEMDVSTFVDICPMTQPEGQYHYPQLPMAVQLPQPIVKKKSFWRKLWMRK